MSINRGRYVSVCQRALYSFSNFSYCHGCESARGNANRSTLHFPAGPVSEAGDGEEEQALHLGSVRSFS